MDNDTYARLAARFGIGVATAFGYVSEAVDLLAARALAKPERIMRASALHLKIRGSC